MLVKFRGRERQLFKGLKKKYKAAPQVLLAAPAAAKVAQQHPKYWSRKQVMCFRANTVVDSGSRA